ncbi:hypothetical protein JCM10207_002429 [Rhodosporidiobolus poonsookiae]
MKTMTLEEVLALPAAYGIPRELATYAEYYGPYMQQAYFQAYVAFCYNSYYVAEVFNHVTYGVVGLIMLTALAIRLFNHFVAGKTLPNWLVSTRTFLSKHLVLGSVLGGKASEPHAVFGLKWVTIQVPTTLHFIMISLYVLFNALVAFCWYESLSPNVWYQDLGYHFDALLRNFSDRTGIIAIAATPLAIVLAGRNSPIAAFTGASYSTLQLYHRWVSRVAVGHAISHSIGYSLMEGLYSTEAYREEYAYAYWNWGVAATCGGGLLVFGSFRRLREVAYELFLMLHIFAAVAWIVGCYYHVWLLDPEYSYLKYIYGAIALWGFDRFVRWARLTYLNFSLGTKHGGIKRSPLAAEGYLTTCGDFVRLRITMARPWPKQVGGPGSYVFISSPSLRIWENHPFTITWPTGMPEVGPSTPCSGSGSSTPTTPDEKKGFPFGSGSSASLDGTTGWSDQSAAENSASFELVLKKYSGFTSRLAKAVSKEGKLGAAEKVKILVEGPYGENVKLSTVDKVLLVAGGSGVAASTAHLAELAQARAARTLKTQQIVLVWAIRELSTVHILLPYLSRLQSLLPNGSLSLYIYHTGALSSLDKSSASAEATLALFHPVASLLAGGAPQLRTGRPYLGEHVDALVGQGEKAAVSACGPTGMCDAAREAVRSRLGRDGWTSDSLEYHDEVFTW